MSWRGCVWSRSGIRSLMIKWRALCSCSAPPDAHSIALLRMATDHDLSQEITMSRPTQRARTQGQTRYSMPRMTLHAHSVDNPAQRAIAAGQALCMAFTFRLSGRYPLAQLCRCMAELVASGSRVSRMPIAYTAGEMSSRPGKVLAAQRLSRAHRRAREGRRSCAQIRNADYSRARCKAASRANQSHCTSGANGHEPLCDRAGTGRAGAAWP